MVQVKLWAFEKQGYKSHHFLKRIGVGRECFYFVYKFLWLEELTGNDILWATTHDVDNDHLGLLLAFKQN